MNNLIGVPENSIYRLTIVKMLFIASTILSFYACSGQEELLAGGDEAVLPDTVTVDLDKLIYPIHADFWGTNLLFWIDDDAALADGAMADQLKTTNVNLLRYPGGTVSDNFHWETNTLDNIHMFPFEGGEAETDFDEFMQLCQKVGAEPSVVLNTESWVVKGDVPAGAHEAASWLRYTKEKGYDVKYWEIGNETYWHPIMSAEEYAEVVNIYADSLKSIDPNIKIGVNGHWNINFVGTKERFKEEVYVQLMSYRKNIDSKEDYRQYQAFKKNNITYPITRGNSKWWPTVAERCGHNVDMIVVHWYFGPNQLPIMTEKLSEVKNLFSEMYPRKSFLLNMSEYNTIKSKHFQKDVHLYLTEAVGAMLHAGVDITAFWPMRMRWIEKTTLLDYQTAKSSVLAKIYQQLSETLTGSLIHNASSGTVPAYASYDDTSGTVTVVMTGRRIDKATKVAVKIKGNQQRFDSGSIWRIRGSKFDYQIKEETMLVNQGRGIAEIDVAPSEVIIVTFR